MDRNNEISDNGRICFRDHINLGDRIFDVDEIHGDGVDRALSYRTLKPPPSVANSQQSSRLAPSRSPVFG